MVKKPLTKIKRNKDFGFYQLDPLPKTKTLEKFYKDNYVAQAGKAAKVRRNADVKKTQGLLQAVEHWSENDIVKLNEKWVEETVHRAIGDALKKMRTGKSVIEGGCGNGALLAYLARHGFTVEGVEPNEEWRREAKARGVKIHPGMFGEWAQQKKHTGKYDVAIFSNVLEHVIDPWACLKDSAKLLRGDGWLVVRVPNDFTQIQEVAFKKIKPPHRWWICAPDHVSYFNVESLRKFLDAQGFELKLEFVDFPMELFLLMGIDYVNNPQLGRVAHFMRCQLELALPKNLRKKMLNAFAECGLGRNITVLAQKKRA